MKLPIRLLTSAAALLFSTGMAAAATRVADVDLNLRSGPGTQYPVIAVIPAGASLHATNCGPAWCHVDYRGDIGWASEAYLAGTGPVVSYYNYYSEPYYYPYWGYGYGPGFAFGGGYYRHPHHYVGHVRGGHVATGGFGHQQLAFRGGATPGLGGFRAAHASMGAPIGGANFGGAHFARGGFGGPHFGGGAHFGGGHFGGGAHGGHR